MINYFSSVFSKIILRDVKKNRKSSLDRFVIYTSLCVLLRGAKCMGEYWARVRVWKFVTSPLLESRLLFPSLLELLAHHRKGKAKKAALSVRGLPLEFRLGRTF